MTHRIAIIKTAVVQTATANADQILKSLNRLNEKPFDLFSVISLIAAFTFTLLSVNANSFATILAFNSSIISSVRWSLLILVVDDFG